MKSYKVIDLLEEVMSGEWGQEPDGENDVKVLRTTNFTNEGRLDLSKEIVTRSIEKKKVEKKKLQYGDIIIEKSGGSPDQPVGRVVYFDIEDNDIYLCNNFTSILRPNSKKVENKYLLYFLYYQHKIRKVLKYQNKTTGIINLKLDNYLNKTDIVLPPRKIQQRVVELLDKSYELIEKRKSQIEALDQLTQSVFLEMFGDPINTKWKTEKLSEITDVRDGTHDSPKYIQKGYPLVTSKNIKDGEIDLTNVNYISEEDYEKINQRSKVDIGDIIMPMIGTIGNPVIVNVEPNFAIKNVALIKFYPDTCIINIYLKYLLDSHYLDFVLSKNRRGGTQKFLSLKNIRNMEIPVPPIKLQKDFTKVIREINEKKKLLNKSLDEMVNAYNSIMQRAFKGELFTEETVSNL